MINPEKLLGQLVGGMLGKQGKKGKKGKNDLLGGLTSGAGLMTAIGLAVGAYEVLKEKKTGGMVMPGVSSAPTPPPFPSTGQATPPPPPPVPPVQQAVNAVPAAGPAIPQASAVETGELSNEEIARRMIQVMAAAANADGMMDEREEQAILERLRGLDISQEERLYLLDELHHPKEVAALVAGVSNPATARTMYMLACAAIEIDTKAERAWLDDLANGLGLSPAVQKFIEEQNG
jgi:uncharacterized membrane protein YebE (DUF533 family)